MYKIFFAMLVVSLIHAADKTESVEKTTPHHQKQIKHISKEDNPEMFAKLETEDSVEETIELSAVQSLDISNTTEGLLRWIAHIEKMKSLSNLNISGCAFSNEHLPLLHAALRNKRLKKLGASKIRKDVLNIMSEQLELEQIDVSNCDLYKQDVKFLSNAKRALRTIDLSNNPTLGEEGCSHFIETLPLLVSINISGCNLTPENEELPRLAKALNHKRLTSINLSHNKNLTASIIARILASQRLDWLKKLELSGCAVDAETLPLIIDSLEKRGVVEEVDVSNIQLTGTVIATLIQKSKKLKKLNISGCGLKPEDLSKIKTALENTEVTEVTIKNNPELKEEDVVLFMKDHDTDVNHPDYTVVDCDEHLEKNKDRLDAKALTKVNKLLSAQGNPLITTTQETTTLDFSSYNLTPTDLKILSGGKWEKLETLILKNNKNISISDVLHFLPSAQSVKILDLSFCGIDTRKLKKLNIEKPLEIEQLNVGHNPHFIIDHLTAFVEKMDNLSILSCVGCTLDSAKIPKLLKVLINKPVHTLNISHNPLLTECFATFVDTLKELKHLNMSWCNFNPQTEYAFTLLRKAFEKRKIESLNLSGNRNLGWTALQNILAVTPHLKKLDISKCNLPDCKEMHHNFPSTLEWLDLQENRISGDGVKTITSTLPHLKRLNISNCAIDASSDIPDLNLEKLYARWNKCNILKLISEQRNMRKIDLSDCNISPEDLAQIPSILPPTSLKKIYLRRNRQLTPKSIFTFIEQYPELQEIDLTGCDITADSLKLIQDKIPSVLF